MSERARPSTPPPRLGPSDQHGAQQQKSAPLTPNQIRIIETNRLKAKALYEQRLKSGNGNPGAQSEPGRPGQKRSYSSTSNLTELPSSSNNTGEPTSKRPNTRSTALNGPLRPASEKFANYVEYDFSKMTDTKGGFLSTNDDPLSAVDVRGKPPNMSVEAWSKHLLRQKLLDSKRGAFEPPLSALNKDSKDQKKCFECGSIELDWKFLEVFKCRVCNPCKEKLPDKYSLLTKTECKEDYLITDPELRDTEILPHLDRPNPHKSTWNDMQLFLRYQVENRAIAKWGSLEALDEEFEKRTTEKKKKKDAKFQQKLRELKRKTRASRIVGAGAGAAADGRGTVGKAGYAGKHDHVWGVAVDNGNGESVRTCEECGIEVEELVF